MSITLNEARIGNFTSSGIVALTSKGKAAGTFGKPAFTYIEQKRRERRLGRSISNESNARPLVWGKVLEPLVFQQLGMEYSSNSQETIVHPTIPFWSGSPDGIKHVKKKGVMDIKSPMTLSSFCDLVDPLYEGLSGLDAMKDIRENHKEGETYYWQLVSNAIITGSDYAELIVFVPYLSQIPIVKASTEGNPNGYWIWSATEAEVPYLLDDGYYKNINIIGFDVPQEDKDFLTDCVMRAGELLLAGKQLPPIADTVPKALSFKKIDS